MGGENLAKEYLVSKGYVILENNFRTPHGELDLIAEKGGVLVFVEVKTRSSHYFGYPEQAITKRKQSFMKSAAEYYFSSHENTPMTWQFDVISIENKTSGDPVITHFENVIA